MPPVYSSPEFVSEAWQKKLSEDYFAPLPLNVLPVILGPTTRAVYFSGGHVHTQFEELGAEEFPTQNLDGNLTFRRKEEQADIFTDGVISTTIYGLPLIVGAVTSGKVTSAEEWGYTVADTPLPDLVDEMGVHTPQWEPVIKFELIEDTSSGSVGSGDFTLNAFFGESETRRTRPWLDADHGDARKNSGDSVLSLVYDQAYFETLWDTWKSLSSDARRRGNFPGFFGDDTTTSETKSGSYAYLTGGMFWCEPASLAEDDGDTIGYPGGVHANVYAVTRENAPYLYDLTKDGRTQQFYTKGKTEAYLTEEITEKMWCDDRGIYQPDGTAFDGIGWRPLAFDSIDTEMNARLTPDFGGKSRCRLIPADANSYRVTLGQFAYLYPDPVETLTDKVLVVEKEGHADFDYEYEGYEEHFISSTLKKLEVKLADETWQEIEVVYGMIGGRPFPGVRLFSMIQVRDGTRWGFLSYGQAGDYPTGDSMTYGIERSSEARYFKKQLYRQRHQVVAEVPEE